MQWFFGHFDRAVPIVIGIATRTLMNFSLTFRMTKKCQASLRLIRPVVASYREVCAKIFLFSDRLSSNRFKTAKGFLLPQE
ncbi:MAG: hypothetical protein CMH48_05515 [Muricauda sp.]|nr:hypothetical protein [Allomuricauda sp.]MBC30284.1 hypothetical protein [Allomuricauda sp.]